MLVEGFISFIVGLIAPVIHGAGYRDGYTEGEKAGYEVASNEYEKKLLQQADDFLNQQRDFVKEKSAYEELLDAYEKEIDYLQKRLIRQKEKMRSCWSFL